MSETQDENTLEPERQRALKTLLARLPESYSERHAALAKIRHAFHQEMATELEAYINHHVAAKPQETFKERSELAAWINQQLREIGLSVQCPNTYKPATLVIDYLTADDPETTRFRFAVRSEDGKQQRTAGRRQLPQLKLTEHLPRIEPGAKYFRGKPPDSLQR